MNDLGLHLFLFLLSGTIIVAISCMFTEAADDAALRSFPKRWLSFFGGCTLVAVLMLVAEHTFASIH